MQYDNLVKKYNALADKPVDQYTKNDWLNYYRMGDYERLDELCSLPQSTVIYTNLKHVSKSGMVRHITMFYIKDNKPHHIRFLTDDVFNHKINQETESYHVSGCGMDMGFHLVYSLSQLVSKKKTGEFDGYWFLQEWIH